MELKSFNKLPPANIHLGKTHGKQAKNGDISGLFPSSLNSVWENPKLESEKNNKLKALCQRAD